MDNAVQQYRTRIGDLNDRIDYISQIIIEYERHRSAVQTRAISEKKMLETIEHEHSWYKSQYDQLDDLKQVRARIRLEGGSFFVSDISLLKRSPSWYRLNVGAKLHFHRQNGSAVQYIHQIQSIRILSQDQLTLDGFKVNCIQITWSFQKQPVKYLVQDAEEFVECIGTHIQRYNLQKVTLVRHLKHLYALSQTPFQPEFHQDYLERIASGFGQTLENVNWPTVGFQSNNPASDLRGAGVMALDLLSHASSDVTFDNLPPSTVSENTPLGPPQPDPSSSRSRCLSLRFGSKRYPWAACGVNIAAWVLFRLLHVSDTLIGCPDSDPSWTSPLLTYLAYFTPPPSSCTLSNTSFLSSLSIPTSPIQTSHGDDMNVVHRAFGEFMKCLDYVYGVRGTSEVGYMDFPKILETMDETLREWLKPFGSVSYETQKKDGFKSKITQGNIKNVEKCGGKNVRDVNLEEIHFEGWIDDVMKKVHG